VSNPEYPTPTRDPQVVFQNDNFIVFDKPPFFLTVPSQWGEEDPRYCLEPWSERELGLRIYPVHRLDFEVGGLVLFAKTPESQKRAGEWFECRDVEKIYQAISEKGKELPPGSRFEWQSMIHRGKKRSTEAPIGKLGVTRAKLVKQDADRSYWELEPLTGRPHQLRFELAKQGFALVGDKLYGSKTDWPDGGVALRAVSLELKFVPEKKRMGLPAMIKVKPLF
jgi:tRNA pseudouridine32 synthase / 23S rRNA pseudouridine746 synthase